MKKIIFIILISYLDINYSQAPDFQWAKNIGGNNDDFSNSIVTDSIGNVYNVGRFEGVADFDPGINVVNLSSNGSKDVYINKLDSNGDFIWVKQIGGTGAESSLAINIDINGDLYISGYFRYTVDFDPGIGVYNLTSNGLSDIFILKLDDQGNFIWAKQIGGSDNDMSNSLVTDMNNNVCISGYFKNTVDFDPGSGSFNLSSNGGMDSYILKLDVNGNFLWAKSIANSNSNDYGLSIDVDNFGNVYSTGIFEGTVDFDPSSSIYNLTSNGSDDMYIHKLDENGIFVWVKQMGGVNSDRCYSITIDDNNNIYTTGYFSSPIVDFDPGSGVSNLNAIGGSDAFIQKLDYNGNFLWVKHIGGSGSDEGGGITTDEYENIYFTGYFEGVADFDIGGASYYLTDTAYMGSIFICKYDIGGNFGWAVQIGGDDFDQGIAIELDNNNNIYTTGHFYSVNADFDPSSGVYNLSPASSGVNYNCDAYVHKLGYCNIDNSVTNNYPTLTANATGSTYQWLDCNNNYAVISGATSQNYTIPSNGNYAVEITNNNCVDTSSCVIMSDVSIDENINTLKIYPNPNNGEFIIKSDNIIKGKIEISNYLGQIVEDIKINNNISKINLSNKIEKGVYFVKVINNNKLIILVEKIIIE